MENVDKVNTNKPNKGIDRKFLIAEIVLIVVSAIFLVFGFLTARSAIEILKKPSGVIGGIIMLPLFIIATIISLSLSLVSLSISIVALTKTKCKRQIATLVVSFLLMAGAIILMIWTLAIKH